MLTGAPRRLPARPPTDGHRQILSMITERGEMRNTRCRAGCKKPIRICTSEALRRLSQQTNALHTHGVLAPHECRR